MPAPEVEDLVRLDRVGEGAVVLVVVAGGIVAVVQLYKLLVAVRVLIHARRLRTPPDERNQFPRTMQRVSVPQPDGGTARFIVASGRASWSTT